MISARHLLIVFSLLLSVPPLSGRGVDPAAASELAREQGEIWRGNARARAVLPGAGPDGQARIQNRARSTEPELIRLRQDLVAQAALAIEWPILPYRSPEDIAQRTHQSLYNTRQELWMGDSADQLVLLSMAAALRPDDQALHRRIRDLALALCRHPHWGAEEPGVRKPNQDLAAGHAARGLAIAWAWHPRLWDDNPAEKEFLLRTIRERVNVLCDAMSGGVYWAGLYQDNHNHINAAGVGLCGAAFLDALPEDAPRWLAAAKLNFDEVARCFHADGSSYEGLSYWSYSASFILQWLESVRGIIDVEPYYAGAWLRNMGTYRLHASSPSFSSVLPWGDTVARDASGPQHILNRLAAEYRDPSAQYLAGKIPFPPQRGLDVIAWNWLWHDPSVPARPPAALDGHLRDLDVIDTRSGWGPGDYQLSLKSGYTNRNHSHLDAGAIAFAFGSEWLLPSPGYGTGNGDADFWNFHDRDGQPGRRWNYFSNATESHTTLLVNGRNQLSTNEARGTVRTFVGAPGALWAEIDLGKAYADVRSIWRRVLHRRGDYILILDDATLPVAGRVEWLLQLPPDAVVGARRATVQGAAGSLDVSLLEPAAATFTPRAPLSPKMDVPSTRLKSHAATVQVPAAQTAQFRAMLVPRFPGASGSFDLKSHGSDHYEITGEGWIDEFRVSGAAADAPARLLLVRREAGEVTDVLSINETIPSLPFLSSPSTVSLAATRVGTDIWIISSDTPADLAFASPWQAANLPDGRRLVRRPAANTKDFAGWESRQSQLHSPPAMLIRALPSLAPVPAAARVIVEAEDFVQELSGTAKLSNRQGNFGKSLTGFGQNGPRHTLAWKVTVPVSGVWRVRIRYGATLHNTTVALLVDGAAPATAALAVPLPGTPSWFYDDNWREHDLSTPDGAPLLLSLAAGEHELRLTLPSSPLNLDRLELLGLQP